MNIPRVALGKGFATSKVQKHNAPVHNVDISNGMPIVSEKKNKWIPKDLKKGRFTKYCKRKGFEGPNQTCANQAMQSSNASVRGMASFYKNVPAKKSKK